MQAQYKELVRSVEETDAELERLKSQHKQQLTEQAREHEKTVFRLLQQVAHSDDVSRIYIISPFRIIVALHRGEYLLELRCNVAPVIVFRND